MARSSVTGLLALGSATFGNLKMLPDSRDFSAWRTKNQPISDRKPREGARRHVATEGFCAARVAGSGSCWSAIRAIRPSGLNGLIRFRARWLQQSAAAYKIIPSAFGMKIASSALDRLGYPILHHRHILMNIRVSIYFHCDVVYCIKY